MNEEINIGAIAEALTDKLDIDIENITTKGKSNISKMGMPSTKYIDLTLGASGSTYTAPANGWFACWRDTTGTGHLRIFNTTINLGSSSVCASATSLIVHMPVIQGDEVKVEYATGTTNNFMFIYAEGEQ